MEKIARLCYRKLDKLCLVYLLGYMNVNKSVMAENVVETWEELEDSVSIL